ncbi:hypothetical protein [Microbacterium sp. GXF6406]
MTTLQASKREQARQTLIAFAAAHQAVAVWDRLGEDFSTQWDQGVRDEMIRTVQAGRSEAISQADGYIDRALAEQGLAFAAAGGLTINTQRLLATTPDGRTLGGLLDNGIIKAKQAIAGGSGWHDALVGSRDFIASATSDTIRQTASDFVSIDATRRPGVGGYVRQLSVPSCRSCVALAGAFYRTNTGFQRHPKCDCIHVPVSDAAAAEPYLTDPKAYFNSLSRAQQDAVFGERDAQAIRDGANPVTVINKRARGQNKRSTNLTIDDIYTVAGDNRDRAITLLRENGYLSESGRVTLARTNRVDRRDLTDPRQLTSAERRAAAQ